jgi:hypothetical protein
MEGQAPAGYVEYHRPRQDLGAVVAGPILLVLFVTLLLWALLRG